ncbi:hypothetical protein GGF32_008472 [Allomyces javanicus]|nr:hypothetical protein GGF32_008472 [Allomyces javanicus]
MPRVTFRRPAKPAPLVLALTGAPLAPGLAPTFRFRPLTLIELVSTALNIDFQDLGVESHTDLLARADSHTYANPTTTVPQQIVTRLYRTEDLFLKTLETVLRLREEMSVTRNGRTRAPGIVFKAGRQDLCEQQFRKGSTLQTFGRGNSRDPDFRENVLVMSDVLRTVSMFPERFREYVHDGILGRPRETKADQAEHGAETAAPTTLSDATATMETMADDAVPL